MITVYFTQCDPLFRADAYYHRNIVQPINERLKEYERFFNYCTDSFGLKEINFATYTLDELFLLIAQSYKRKGIIKNIEFVSCCRCNVYEEKVIPLDDQGDMLVDPHHGFFSQRLKYLR